MEPSDVISNTDDISVERERVMSDDLLVEILVRLPLKPLFRFKCVSKSWYHLISDDYVRRRLPLVMAGVFFASDSDSNKDPRYSCSSGEGSLEDCDLPFFPFRHDATIIDGCGGLLLFYKATPTAFYVVSPATRRWAALPPPTKKTLLSILVFDPSSSPDYKVICFTKWCPQGAELEVFSSETGTWIEQVADFGVDTDSVSATMHYFNGTLYILAYPNHIVSINLTKMDCRLIGLPEPMNRSGRIGHCRGCLYYSHNGLNQVKIWMLKNSEKCRWVLKESIKVREIIGGGSRAYQVNFMAFHPEREIVYIWAQGKLLSYDLQKRRVEESWEFGKENDKAYLIQIWLFPFSRYLLDCLG